MSSWSRLRWVFLSSNIVESGVRNLKKHIEKVCVLCLCRCECGLLKKFGTMNRYIARLRLNLFRILEKMLSLNPNNLRLRLTLARGQLTRPQKTPHHHQKNPSNHHHHHHPQNQRQRPTKHLWNHHRPHRLQHQQPETDGKNL